MNLKSKKSQNDQLISNIIILIFINSSFILNIDCSKKIHNYITKWKLQIIHKYLLHL